jgi:parallel beta-helix repeat protein
VARFGEREQNLGRTDLILPVYYVTAQEMDDPDRRRADELASLLWSRQYADWRELRFEPLTSPVVRKALAQLATRMRDTFWQSPEVPAVMARASARSAARGDVTAAGGVPRQDIARTEPPTHVVDAYQRGHFATVSEAIEAAKPGDRILVRPGLYEESLIVNKPLEIIGDGPVEDIVIRARDANVLTFQASIGRVANLTLRQVGEEVMGVSIQQGRLDLEGCDLSSQAGSCVSIRDGRLDLEGCDLSSQAGSCVSIRDGADPRLRRNKIHHGKERGVIVYDDGLGTLEDNEIFGNGFHGVTIGAGGNPVLRRNQIRGNETGVYVHDNGQGTLEDNEITGNGETGVEIQADGNPLVRGNRINRNEYEGVWVHDAGKGVIEDNDLTGNGASAWAIDKACKPNVTRARNKE